MSSEIRASRRTTAAVSSAIEPVSSPGEGSRVGIPHGTRVRQRGGGPRYPSTLNVAVGKEVGDFFAKGANFSRLLAQVVSDGGRMGENNAAQ